MRCIPADTCPQADSCGRATSVAGGDAIDGSALAWPAGHCPLFIDARAWRLLPLPVVRHSPEFTEAKEPA